MIQYFIRSLSNPDSVIITWETGALENSTRNLTKLKSKQFDSTEDYISSSQNKENTLVQHYKVSQGNQAHIHPDFSLYFRKISTCEDSCVGCQDLLDFFLFSDEQIAHKTEVGKSTHPWTQSSFSSIRQTDMRFNIFPLVFPKILWKQALKLISKLTLSCNATAGKASEEEIVNQKHRSIINTRRSAKYKQISKNKEELSSKQSTSLRHWENSQVRHRISIHKLTLEKDYFCKDYRCLYCRVNETSMFMKAWVKGTGVHTCACMYICIQQNVSS